MVTERMRETFVKRFHPCGHDKPSCQICCLYCKHINKCFKLWEKNVYVCDIDNNASHCHSVYGYLKSTHSREKVDFT